MLWMNENDDLIVFPGETSKAHVRRLAEGWYKYAPDDKIGLDIGCKDDPINKTFRRWDLDLGDGDATYLEGLETNKYWTVYASHVLEHLQYPRKAIRRWYEVLRPGGHLIIMVPHRDLYEQRVILPSRWNQDHKSFWLPDEEDLPCTKSLRKEILAAIPGANIVVFQVLQDGYRAQFGRGVEPYCSHPVGEHSIEAIIKKPEF